MGLFVSLDLSCGLLTNEAQNQTNIICRICPVPRFEPWTQYTTVSVELLTPKITSFDLVCCVYEKNPFSSYGVISFLIYQEKYRPSCLIQNVFQNQFYFAGTRECKEIKIVLECNQILMFSISFFWRTNDS
jgi:hypothetical protein